MARCVCTAKQDQRRPELLAEERRVCSVSSVLIFGHVWADLQHWLIFVNPAAFGH